MQAEPAYNEQPGTSTGCAAGTQKHRLALPGGYLVPWAVPQSDRVQRSQPFI